MNRAATLRLFLSLCVLTGAGACLDFEKAGLQYCDRNKEICTPVVFPAIDKASSRGNHTLALGVDRSVWALGQNNGGQLGDGTTEDNPNPRKVEGLEPSKQVAAGYRHSMALTGGGRIMLWGTLGTNPIQKTPTLVAGLEHIEDISAGEAHCLALSDQGEVWAWGSGPAGLASATPVRVVFPEGVRITQISAGKVHSLALSSAGEVWAWGDNSHGQLGASSSTARMTPQRVEGWPSGTRINSIAAGGYHSLAMNSAAEVWAWGDNSRGQLGDGSETSSATPVKTALMKTYTVTKVAAGGYHSLALNSQTGALAWGDNSKSQLGVDPKLELNSSPIPMDVKAVDNAQSIAAGEVSSLMVSSSGCLHGWGSNEKGQLGPGFNGEQLPAFQYATPIICQTPVHQPPQK